ncbi:hypothetical protein BAUCODRAFT_37740 [Baudoinia panamericana UAMH 10762]|uniref:NADH:flavin oxidoreductase/NADH oxidase N-terminal domain-containing protein n=1 Tax=Baudoinia panamericana (strain UAMH 10762) TaxID=717646 RepID=M2N1J7_BAUPA|nr:uncharacterized protein BAUCODRAFT_37740 [Baudoinia panamericana UAMH 10762]EMC92829.1 hypothetical protein BAUCODRAFT_37740 [Baudoinia panamericana UAMH 10762]
MAPLTRFRATMDHIPSQYAREYYEQRASVPGTLIITEATFISPRAGGYNNVPGIWNDEQVQAWKEIVDAVHAKGSFIYLQLWALGRAAGAEQAAKNLQREGPFPVVSSSGIPISSEYEEPVPIAEEEVPGWVEEYARATRNAMKAGFDGVEIHGANGYLVDQFWQDVCNIRTDKYGGSIENRARFGLEVTRAVIGACGGDAKKVGMRLSPWSTFQSMHMKDPIPQFTHIIRELKALGLAYLHLVESRTGGGSAPTAIFESVTGTNDKLIEVWGSELPIILAGGFDAEKGLKAVGEVYTGENICIAYGRFFISNPDLPFRIREGIALQKYDRKTFYTPEAPEGFIDYPFCEQFVGQGSKL